MSNDQTVSSDGTNIESMPERTLTFRDENLCTSNRKSEIAIPEEQDDIKHGHLSIPVPVRRTYIDEVAEDLKCPICLDCAVNCTTSCGHSFCFTCINAHINNRIRHQQTISCPMCRNLVASNRIVTIQGDTLQRVRGLNVACLGSLCGCTETGLLSEMEIHEKKCPQVLVFCKFRELGCSAPLVRKVASVHECRCRFNPKVRVCKFNSSGCRVRGPDYLLFAHEKKCRYRNMEKFVECRWSETGCGLRVKKFYRDKHTENCAFRIINDIKTSDSPPVETSDIKLSISWIKGTTPLPPNELIKQISKFIPNVQTIQNGRVFGEFDIILKSIPVTALRSIGMAIDPQISENFKALGLIAKGISTVINNGV